MNRALLAILLLATPAAALGPDAELSGPDRVASVDDRIYLETTGSRSDSRPVIALDRDVSAGDVQMTLFTSEDQAQVLAAVQVRTPGLYRFICHVTEEGISDYTTHDVWVGETPDPPAPTPPAPPPPTPDPVPPAPTPPPPAPSDLDDGLGLARPAFEFAVGLPAADRVEGARYAEALEQLAGLADQYRRPAHDALAAYFAAAADAVRRISGDTPDGFGRLDEALADWIGRLHTELALADADGYYDAGVYSRGFLEIARGLRAAAGR